MGAQNENRQPLYARKKFMIFASRHREPNFYTGCERQDETLNIPFYIFFFAMDLEQSENAANMVPLLQKYWHAYVDRSFICVLKTNITKYLILNENM